MVITLKSIHFNHLLVYAVFIVSIRVVAIHGAYFIHNTTPTPVQLFFFNINQLMITNIEFII